MSAATRLDRLATALAARPAVRHPADDAVRRWAAVAAVLRAGRDEGLELLFIRRPETAGDPWSGHMAFPGGRADPRDADLEATALRETLEEVGLDLARDGRVLGTLDDLAPRNPALPPIVVRPFVTVLHAEALVRPNREVAAWYWVPVAHLRSPAANAEHVVHVSQGPGGNVPTAFAREGPVAEGARVRFPAFRYQDEVIWGLTERVVRQLLPLLDGEDG